MMSSSHALSLHLKMCKLVVEASVEESTSWGDLYKLLPQLRHALACTVCGSIIENPASPSDSQCQHNVCKECIGGKKRLKPSCSYCKDYQAYAPNKQLKLIVDAFRKTCQFLQHTEIYARLNSFSLNGGKSSLVELIQEGADSEEPSKWAMKEDSDAARVVPLVKSEVIDSEHSSNEGVSYHGNIHISSQVSTPVLTSPQIIPSSSSIGTHSQSCPSPEVHFAHQSALSHVPASPCPPTLPPPSSTPVSHPLYSMFFSSDEGRPAKLKGPAESLSYHRAPVAAAFHQPPDSIGSRTGATVGNSGPRSIPRKKVQRGCRCGNATPTPGKLTCCGQRCPCYVESRACMDCKCRGCRNPHRPGGKKVRPHIPNHQNIKIHEVHQPVLLQSLIPETMQNSHQQEQQMTQPHQQQQEPHQQQQQPHQQQQQPHQQQQQPHQQQQQQSHHHHQQQSHQQQPHHQPQQQSQTQPQQPVYQPVRIDSPHHPPGALPPVHHVIHMQHPVFQAPMFINTVPVATLGNSVFMADSSQNGDSIEV